MGKKFHILITAQEQKLFQLAAQKAGLSAAKWARYILCREAESVLKNKTWDQLFADLRSIPNVGEWKVPERKFARLIG